VLSKFDPHSASGAPHCFTSPLRGETYERTGVLLINLGTPDAPTPEAGRYLREFLMDGFVIDVLHSCVGFW
jgi:hypothetical protein